MRLHSRAIYGCTQSEYQAPTGCRFTQNGDRLYLHIYDWPFRHVHLHGLTGKIAYAQLLNDGSEVQILEPSRASDHVHAEVAEGTIALELPVVKPDVVVPVVELFLKA
jgi:alpha-L-fucosidase